MRNQKNEERVSAGDKAIELVIVVLGLFAAFYLISTGIPA